MLLLCYFFSLLLVLVLAYSLCLVVNRLYIYINVYWSQLCQNDNHDERDYFERERASVSTSTTSQESHKVELAEGIWRNKMKNMLQTERVVEWKLSRHEWYTQTFRSKKKIRIVRHRATLSVSVQKLIDDFFWWLIYRLVRLTSVLWFWDENRWSNVRFIPFDCVWPEAQLPFSVFKHHPRCFAPLHWGGRQWLDRVLFSFPSKLSTAASAINEQCRQMRQWTRNIQRKSERGSVPKAREEMATETQPQSLRLKRTPNTAMETNREEQKIANEWSWGYLWVSACFV